MPSTFQPSAYSGYGQTEEESADPAAMLEQYAPAISAMLFGGDPREQAAKLSAKFENYRQLYKNAKTGVAKNFYAMQINKMEAQLEAVQEQAGEERAAVVTTQANKIGLILLLMGGTVAVGSVGWYFVQKAKTEKWKRRQPQG